MKGIGHEGMQQSKIMATKDLSTHHLFLHVKSSLVPTPPAPPARHFDALDREGRNIIPDELARFNEVDTINNFEDYNENKQCWH